MDEGKIRILQPKKIVAEIVDGAGNVVRTLVCDTITRQKLGEIIEAGKRAEDGKRVKYEDVLYEQLAIVFGGKKEDYFDIADVRVVKQIIEFVTEQVKNPI